MLNTSNMVLLVGQADYGDFSSRKITVWNTSTSSVLCSSWPFENKISIAKVNKRRMVVLEKSLLHVYSTEDMKVLHSFEVGAVGLGRLIISPCSEKNNLAIFSNSNDEGIVKVYDLLYLSQKCSIRAHKTPINLLSVNREANRLATCSSKGTIFRIFAIPKGDKLFTLKRGMTNALIHSMNFSYNGEKLLASSETGTLHFFDLKQTNDQV